MNALILDQIHIQYGKQAVVHAIDLHVTDGQIGCLLGPSGCGKTTLLRAIAGFEPVSHGTITLNGQVISSPLQHIAPEQRQVGMVFQDYALFPHLNIADNIGFGMRKASRQAKAQRVAALLELVNLSGYEQRYPHELSGGQQQRIALARALAPRPRLLLLDEPFGSQDVELREILAREVRDILKQEGTTAILVTHDQHEAFAMADEIGVMQAGRLQQWDTAYQLYHHPVNAFVAGFIGQGALIRGQITTEQRVDTAIGCFPLPSTLTLAQGTSVHLLIRPEHIQHITTANSTSPTACIIAKVFRGAETLYTLRLPDQQTLLALLPSAQSFAIGTNVQFVLDNDAPIIFKTDSALDIPHA